MNLPRLFRTIAFSLAVLTPQSVFAAAGDTETGWNLAISGGLARVHATAVQADGKVIIAGDFTTVLGNTRNNIARVNANGTLDTSFSPNPNGVVYAVAIQNDGDIVFGGRFGLVNSGATGRSNLARYNADGTIDTTFTTGTDGLGVYALALDPNGRLFVGGQFATVGGTARNNIARLNQANGALDSTFNPSANGDVRAIAIQGNGQVVLGGAFTSLQPNGAAVATTRNRIARVNSDGTLDSTFNPTASSTVLALAVQGNGQVVLGGEFTTLQPNGAAATTRNYIARVNSDGTLDTGFTAGANSRVNALAVQADGKILYGGNFTTVTASSGYLARLNADGTADAAFDPAANNEVYTIALQADGRILTGGRFTYWTGATTGGFNVTGSARFANDAGSQSLTINQGIILWNRSGSLPDLQDIKLEYEYINPGNWQPFSGTSTRVGTSATWQVVSATGLPASSTIRATGRAGNGTSSSTVQYLQAYSGLLTSGIRVTGNGVTINSSDTTPATNDHTDFGSVLMATSDSISRTFTIQNTGSAPLSLGTVSAQIYKVNYNTPSGYGYDGAFTVTTPPVSPVSPGGTTTFTITFNPSGLRQIAVLDYQVYFDNNSPASGFGFVIRGAGLNTVPTVANPIPDQSINLGNAFTYTIPYQTFSDPDRNFDSFGFPAPTYTAAPLPGGVTLNATSGAFSGAPTAAGSTDITVTYKDSQNATVSDTFRLTVVAPNTRPTVANAIPDQTVTQGDSYSYAFPTNTFADVDAGNVLTYSATGLPPWLAFNPATRTFSGTPGNSNVGLAFITVTATDNGSPALGISDSFFITVLNANDAPTVINPILDQGAIQGVAFSYTVPTNVFFDGDPDTVLTYSATGLPAWLSFNPATRTFSGIPGNSHVGFVDITVTATDNGTPPLGASDVFRITVSNANDAPTVANPIPDQTATQSVAFSYSFPANTFADIDVGDSLTYSVSSLPFWLTYNPATRTFSGTPGNVHVGSVDITVTATDQSFSTVSDTFRLTVLNVNDPPFVANNIGTQIATQGSLFTLTFPENTFTDIDAGNVFSYSATGLPAWLSFDPATRTFSGTPGNGDIGFADITLTASDNGTPTPASTSDAFRLIVFNVNDAPTVANAVPDQAATEDVSFSYTFPLNTFSDIDTGNVFTYSTSTLPGWLSFDPATRTFSGTPGDAEVGLVDIAVTATDNGTPTTAFVTDTFRITVTGVNDMPIFTKGADQSISAATLSVQTIPGWATGISDGDALVEQSLTFVVESDNPSLFATAPVITSDGTLSYTPSGAAGVAIVSVSLTDDAAAGGGALVSPVQTFTITLTHTPLESWRFDRFGSPANSGDGADGFDFDHDGVVNLVEFAFGMNPKVADSVLLPQPVRDGGTLTLGYALPSGVSGISYGAQWSTSLAPDSWEDIANTGAPGQRVFSVPTAGRERMFMRHVIQSE